MKTLAVVLIIALTGCASQSYSELTPEQEMEIGHECALKNSVPDIHDVVE